MFSWSLSSKFEKEFILLPTKDQDKIIEFTDVYEKFGLSDFSRYPGKITPSWNGQDISSTDRIYAQLNSLWHYHIGIPEYREVHQTYKTSDWVLHFQWPKKGNRIILVDLYSHYTSSGDFYLPPSSYLSGK